MIVQGCCLHPMPSMSRNAKSLQDAPAIVQERLWHVQDVLAMPFTASLMLPNTAALTDARVWQQLHSD